MTEETRRDLIEFAKHNLDDQHFSQFMTLIDGDYADDEDACRGYVYDWTPDD